MNPLTPHTLRRLLLPTTAAIFFGSLALASLSLFSTRDFDPRDAIISDLASPIDNPNGYPAAATGMALTGLLLFPAGRLFHNRLHPHNPRLSTTAATLFYTGLAATIVIGVLAPITRDYTPLHIHLAFAAFIGISAGAMAWTAAARPLHPQRHKRITAWLTVQAAILLFLAYLFLTPNFFTNQSLLTSLALWEWLLCLHCTAALWVLSKL